MVLPLSRYYVRSQTMEVSVLTLQTYITQGSFGLVSVSPIRSTTSIPGIGISLKSQYFPHVSCRVSTKHHFLQEGIYKSDACVTIMKQSYHVAPVKILTHCRLLDCTGLGYLDIAPARIWKRDWNS